MLHAVFKNKTRYYRRYLGERDGERVHEEDEITSTTLGALDFLPIADCFQFWKDLIFTAGKQYVGFFPNSEIKNIDSQLWLRRGNIEPDGFIKLEFQNGECRYLLLELKWRAPLSGDNQLKKQWQDFLSNDEKPSTLHLFIAPEISAGLEADDDNIWGGGDAKRLLLLPWVNIRNLFAIQNNKYCHPSTPLGRWSSQVDTFLEKINIRRFRGFTTVLSEANFIHPMQIEGNCFWVGFGGFKSLTEEHFSTNSTGVETIFFKGK